MLTRLKELIKYNQAVKDIDLDHLLSPDSLTKAQFPKRKKTYRTLSLAKELRHLKKEFWYFNDNTIVLEFLWGKGFRKKVITLNGSIDTYKVRVDVWTLTSSSGGNFFYKEFDHINGSNILWELVSLEVLDPSFLPEISDFHKTINEL